MQNNSKEEQEQPVCDFGYQLTGMGRAYMSLQVNGKEFETRLGYGGQDIKDILYALYLVSPCKTLSEDACGFVRKGYRLEKGWVVLNIDPEGTDYTLSFQEEDKDLWIRVMEYDKVLLLEKCYLGKFVYCVVKACDEMLKKHGLIGFSKTFCSSDEEFDINVFLVLKEWVMRVIGYTCEKDEDKWLYFTDYEKELAILAMVM